MVPRGIYMSRRERLIRAASLRQDYAHILERVDYYCKLKGKQALPNEAIHDHRGNHYVFVDENRNIRPSTFSQAYFFDLWRPTRYFNGKQRIGFVPGDIDFTPQFPAIVKSRPISKDNNNSVVLKLDKIRHFGFVLDNIPFRDKKPMAISAGETGTINRKLLGYRYIIANEKGGLTPNLMWIMSSNSIAVMVKPRQETWFMEGRLIADYHYILVKDDLSDLEERINHYNNNPDEAERIIRHANHFVSQFMDYKRERIISLLVAERYFKLTEADEEK